MKKESAIYGVITIIFWFSSLFILKQTNIVDNVALSKSIQIILILFLIRISYGCALFIKRQY